MRNKVHVKKGDNVYVLMERTEAKRQDNKSIAVQNAW